MDGFFQKLRRHRGEKLCESRPPRERAGKDPGLLPRSLENGFRVRTSSGRPRVGRQVRVYINVRRSSSVRMAKMQPFLADNGAGCENFRVAPRRRTRIRLPIFNVLRRRGAGRLVECGNRRFAIIRPMNLESGGALLSASGRLQTAGGGLVEPLSRFGRAPRVFEKQSEREPEFASLGISCEAFA